jgi:hypothetical protein
MDRKPTAKKERRRLKANIQVQQIQERNKGIQETLIRLEHELHTKEQIIEHLLNEGSSSEEYEEISIEDSILSVEAIEGSNQRHYQTARGLQVGLETPVTRTEVNRVARSAGVHKEQESTPRTITKKKTKQEEQKEGLQKAIAWARDRKNYREQKKKENDYQRRNSNDECYNGRGARAERK